MKPIYKESDDYEAYLLDREEYFRTMVDSFGVQAAEEAGLKAHFREFSTAHKSVGNGMTRAEFQESPTHWQEFESTISLIPEVSDWTDIGPFSQPDETGLSGVGGGELGVGPVDFITFDPNFGSNSQLVLVGSWLSGLFVSYDAGLSWQNANTDRIINLSTTSAGDAKIAAQDSDIWFFTSGTGDTFSKEDINSTDAAGGYGDGVFRTIDAGQTWERIGSPHHTSLNGSRGSRLMIHPTDDVTELRLLAAYDSGIYLASNALGTVTQQWVPNNSTAYPSIGWAPSFTVDDVAEQSIIHDGLTYTVDAFWGFDLCQRFNADGDIFPNEVLASGTAHYVSGSGGNTSSIYKAIFLRSSDFGQTWQELQSNIPLTTNSEVTSTGDYLRYALRTIPAEPDVVFMNALYLTDEGGPDYDVRGSILRYNLETNVVQVTERDHCFGLYAADAFAVDPNDAERAITTGGANGIFLDFLNLETGVQTGTSANGYHVDVEHIEYTPDGSKIWVASHGGVYTCDADGSNWETRNNGIGTCDLVDASFDVIESEYIVASNWHNGTFQRYPTNGGFSWRVISGGDGAGTAVNPFDRGQQFSASQFGNWHQSPPLNDDSFNGISEPPQSSSTGVHHLEFNYFVEDVAYMARKDLWRNTTGQYGSSSNWERISPSWYPDPSNKVFGIWPSKADGDLLICQVTSVPPTGNQRMLMITNKATAEASVLQNEDAWAELTHPSALHSPPFTANKWVSGIATNPENPNVFYVTSAIHAIADWKITRYEYLDGNILSASVAELADQENWLFTDLTANLNSQWFGVGNIGFIPGSEELFVVSYGLGIFYAKEADLLQYQEGVSEDAWHLYGDNTPYLRANTLEFDHNTHTLYTGFRGRGIWQNDLPCWQDDDLVLTEDLAITNFARFHQNIIVPSGRTLKVYGTMQMSSGTHISVEPGGELLVDGGTIEGACEEPWHGIYVAGPVGSSQTNSATGVASFISDATITDATTAVNNFLVLASDGCSPDYNTVGGIIQADGATFIDNRRDAQFLGHVNDEAFNGYVDDLSYFKNTSFLTTDDLVVQQPEANVTMYKVRNIQVRSCTFHDQRAAEKMGADRRTGLKTILASYTVAPDCPSGVDCEAESTLFKDLAYGIKSRGDMKSSPITVHKTEFDSYKGAYLEGLNYLQFTDNIVQSTRFLTADPTENPYGVYLADSRAYQVEGNVFNNLSIIDFDNPYAGDPVGLVVYNDHEGSEQIYRNEFNGLAIGTEALGLNREVGKDETGGLQIRCNKNVGNPTDVYVKSLTNNGSEGIAEYQGAPTGLAEDLAGNLFTEVPGGHPQYKNYLNAGDVNIQYFMHDPATEPRVAPSYGPNFNSLTLFVQSNLEWQDGHCVNLVVVPLAPQDGMDQKNFHAQEAQSRQNILDAMVDDGNTQAVQWEVMSADQQDAWNKYVELMSMSGFVSNEVLKEVAEKEDAFTKGMIRDVMYANPHGAKDPEVQEKLDSRNDLLPAYMREQIDLGLTELSSKEYLEVQRDRHRTAHDLIISRSMRDLLRDEAADPADAVGLLSGSSDYELDKSLVDYYLGSSEEALAEGYLNYMATVYTEPSQVDDLNDYTDFRQLMGQWEGQPLQWQALDQDKLDVLTSYATSNGWASNEATALLALNGIEIAEEVYTPSADEKSREVKKHVVPKVNINALSVYPNPTDGQVTITYRLEGKAPRLQLIDGKGVVAYELGLRLNDDQITIDVSSLKAGSYQLLISTSIESASESLSIK